MMMEQGSVGPGGAIGDAGDAANLPSRLNEPQGSPVVNLRNKVVHFDLKGMPPIVEAYKTIFPFLKNIGVTGVLMEYEDMFPFHGKLAGITNRAAYNASDIKTILDLAKSNNLEVRAHNIISELSIQPTDFNPIVMSLWFIGYSTSANIWSHGVCAET